MRLDPNATVKLTDDAVHVFTTQYTSHDIPLGDTGHVVGEMRGGYGMVYRVRFEPSGRVCELHHSWLEHVAADDDAYSPGDAVAELLP